MEDSVSEPVSLEYVTTVSARGIAPANAVVERLTTSECRLRTVVLFDIGDGIEFPFGPEAASVRGTVRSRAISGSRFVYSMRLDRMSAKETDALARATAQTVASPAASLSRADGLTRSSPRVPGGFNLTYRTSNLHSSEALAVDVSSDGLMMSCAEMLIPGVPVELRFTLPLDAVPQSAEMTLGARVVSRQELKKGTFVYGLAFMRLEDEHRKTLRSYVNAMRGKPTSP